MKLVLIEWLDAFGCSTNWQDMSDVEETKLLVCQSVGWLASDRDECKVLVPHMTKSLDDPQGCGDMTIPTVAIQRIVELKEATG